MENRIKTTFLLCITLCVNIFISSFFCATARAQEVTPIVWGGGGAFTGVTSYKEHLYLSSDVAGIWKQKNGSWEPYVEGLTQYNVTSLVVFNDLLLATTADELLYTKGDGRWFSTNIKLNTYRSITDQPYSVSPDLGLLCIASRNSKIECLDKSFKQISIPIGEKPIGGIIFQKQQDKGSSNLYFYSNKKLLSVDVKTKKTKLLAKFDNKVTALVEYGAGLLIATSKNIYDLQNLNDPIYSVSLTNIVNLFVTKTGDETYLNKGSIFVGLGSKWNLKLHKLTFDNNIFMESVRTSISFDPLLPHRKSQTTLTKFLSVNQIGDETYVTDYWGVYKVSDLGTPKLIEVTGNAYNVVATDLVVADNYLYVSTMDNGVIKIDKVTKDSKKRSVQAISFGSIKGHAWSMMYYNKTLFAIFSPWDKANEFLFRYSEMDESKTITQLTNTDSRTGRGSFWGKSYARELVYYYGIVSFKDGANGGLVVNEPNMLDMEEPYTFGEFNKVYKAMEELNGLLYVATCEGPPTVMALNQSGEAEFSIRFPKGFCAFTSYKHNDMLYFLGTQKGRSVIYKLVGNRIKLFADMEIGSAFYSMAINPLNEQQIVVATISWSKKATSGLFITNNGGKDFIDQSCLLSHKNGVAAIDFDMGNSWAYILQKVGGLMSMSISQLFSENTCASDA